MGGEIDGFRLVEAMQNEVLAVKIAEVVEAVRVHTIGKIAVLKDGVRPEGIHERLSPMIGVLANRVAAEVEAFIESAVASECSECCTGEEKPEEERLLRLVADAEEEGTSVEAVCDILISLSERFSVQRLREIARGWTVRFSPEFVRTLTAHNAVAVGYLESIFGRESVSG